MTRKEAKMNMLKLGKRFKTTYRAEKEIDCTKVTSSILLEVVAPRLAELRKALAELVAFLPRT
jgi:hypothetical protein